MNYQIEVIVEIANTEDNPAREEIKVSRGILTSIIISPQVYLGGTVKARIFLEGVQLYPTSVGQYYTIIEDSVKIQDRYMTFPKESRIEIMAWAVGARYRHKLVTLVNIIPLVKEMRRVGL